MKEKRFPDFLYVRLPFFCFPTQRVVIMDNRYYNRQFNTVFSLCRSGVDD